MIKSPQCRLARYLNFFIRAGFNLLQFVVKDSFEVIERIRYAKSTNTVLTSFDVKQLFTNVTLEESIKVSVDKLNKFILNKKKLYILLVCHLYTLTQTNLNLMKNLEKLQLFLK